VGTHPSDGYPARSRGPAWFDGLTTSRLESTPCAPSRATSRDIWTFLSSPGKNGVFSILLVSPQSVRVLRPIAFGCSTPFQRRVYAVNRLAERFAGFLEAALGYLFLVITLVTIVLVVLRYFFGTTIVGGQEFAVFCFIYTTALGAAVLLARDGHIAIQVFVDLLPPRAQRWFRRINHLLVALLNGILVVLSVPWILSIYHFPSPVLRIPQGFVLMSLPLGCALVTLYALWLAFTDRRPSAPADERPA
jgi:TRAP-type C4-dicarboxylate transport system permease small subunit